MPTYAVFAGEAGGVACPIVYIDNNMLSVVAHGSAAVFAYKDGAIISHPLEGSWLGASQSIIEQAGLQVTAGDQKYVATFEESQIEARLMVASEP